MIGGDHGRGYSSPLRWASTKPYVLGMTQIGLRGTGSARRGEFEAARDYRSRIFTAEEFHAAGYQSVLATVPAKYPVYLRIDADGLGPTEALGVLWPVPRRSIPSDSWGPGRPYRR